MVVSSSTSPPIFRPDALERRDLTPRFSYVLVRHRMGCNVAVIFKPRKSH
jgi:hypothetical protein